MSMSSQPLTIKFVSKTIPVYKDAVAILMRMQCSMLTLLPSLKAHLELGVRSYALAIVSENHQYWNESHRYEAQ